MEHFMVFAGSRRNLPGYNAQGNQPVPFGFVWEPEPVGVFRAGDPESACRAAAKKRGHVGTFFAIAGVPWGVEMNPVENVSELGWDEEPRAPQLGAGAGPD